MFVGSGIFKSDHAADRAKAIVQATTHYKDAKVRRLPGGAGGGGGYGTVLRKRGIFLFFRRGRIVAMYLASKQQGSTTLVSLLQLLVSNPLETLWKPVGRLVNTVR